MKASLPEIRLAQTRLFAGCGRRWRPGQRIGDGEEAVDDVGGSAHAGLLAEHGSHCRHLLLVRLVAFVSPHGPRRALRFDHRDAFAVDRPDEDRLRWEARCGAGAPGVERLEVGGGVLDDLLRRALRDGDAGHLGEHRDGLVERAADGRSHNSSLEFVAVGPRRKAQFGVEGVDARLPRGAVTDPGHRDRPEDGEHRPGVQLLVGEAHRAVGAVDDDGRPDVAVTAGVEVGLEGEAHQFPAPLFGLALDLGQTEVVSGRRGQVALQVPERFQRRAAHERPVSYWTMTTRRLSAAHQQRRLQRIGADYEAAKARLTEVGFTCEGSLIERYTSCHNPRCRCADPNQRHGPYWQLSWKEGGRTVSRLLSSEEARLYQEWIANRRRLESLLTEIRDLSRQAGEYITANAGLSFRGPQRPRRSSSSTG